MVEGEVVYLAARHARMGDTRGPVWRCDDATYGAKPARRDERGRLELPVSTENIRLLARTPLRPNLEQVALISVRELLARVQIQDSQKEAATTPRTDVPDTEALFR